MTKIVKWKRKQLKYKPKYGGIPRGLGIKPELKFHELLSTAQQIPTTGLLISSMVLIAEGLGEEARIGRRIHVTSLSALCTLELPSSTVEADMRDLVRVIFYVDSQCNGANLAVNDILEDALYDSFRNLAEVPRVRVIKEFWVSFNPSVGNDGANDRSAPMNEIVKFTKVWTKPLPIDYNGTSASVINVTQNNIGAIAICESGVVQIRIRTRVRYYDI